MSSVQLGALSGHSWRSHDVSKTGPQCDYDQPRTAPTLCFSVFLMGPKSALARRWWTRCFVCQCGFGLSYLDRKTALFFKNKIADAGAPVLLCLGVSIANSRLVFGCSAPKGGEGKLLFAPRFECHEIAFGEHRFFCKGLS